MSVEAYPPVPYVVARIVWGTNSAEISGMW